MSWKDADTRSRRWVSQHDVDDRPSTRLRLPRTAPGLSTSPDPGFVRVPMAERRDATGVDVIRGLVLARIGADAFTGDPITKPSEWFPVLADVFDLHLDTLSAEARGRLWQRVLQAHHR